MQIVCFSLHKTMEETGTSKLLKFPGDTHFKRKMFQEGIFY